MAYFAKYLAAAVDSIHGRPSWVTAVITLEPEHDGGEREGISEGVDLVAGEYALICVDSQGFADTGPTAVALAPVSVKAP
jgi:hypothetical protein